jgi:hypothetical protein
MDLQTRTMDGTATLPPSTGTEQDDDFLLELVNDVQGEESIDAMAAVVQCCCYCCCQCQAAQ